MDTKRVGRCRSVLDRRSPGLWPGGWRNPAQVTAWCPWPDTCLPQTGGILAGETAPAPMPLAEHKKGITACEIDR